MGFCCLLQWLCLLGQQCAPHAKVAADVDDLLCGVEKDTVPVPQGTAVGHKDRQ